LQALEEGDLSERARRRAEELANDADLRVTPPRSRGKTQINHKPITIRLDKRLPTRDTVITRQYKGRTVQVRVTTDGFEYEGETYKSLSAVAKAVTGAHWNGYHFFDLKPQGGAR
jgi:hypothetical protein